MRFHRVRLIAGMERAFARSQRLVYLTFAQEFRLAMQNRIQFLGWMMMPWLPKLRRHIDDKAQHLLAAPGPSRTD